MHAILSASISLLLVHTGAHAVIVAGASGGYNTSNNTTAAQFFEETGNELSIYDNVVQLAGGSGTYLGYDPATRAVWVLTARHISIPLSTSIQIQGNTYALKSTIDVGGDLRLARFSNPANIVPSLPSVTLAGTIPVANTSLVMIGFGRERQQMAATTANSVDAIATSTGIGYTPATTRIKRWGTNQVERIGKNSVTANYMINANYSSIVYRTLFDSPESSNSLKQATWMSSNEGQGSMGDSGGGAFVLVDGEWQLTGVMSMVSNRNEFTFNDSTYFTDVSTYKTFIDDAIGMALIPESGVLAIIGVLVILASLRHQRDGESHRNRATTRGTRTPLPCHP